MSWRVEVHHRTTYRYAGNVVSSYNEARLTPVTSAHQTVLSSAIEVSPRVTPFRYIDAFGSAVHSFDLHQPHDQLSVVGHSVTETMAARQIATGFGWESMRSDKVADHFFDFLSPTPLVNIDDEMRATVESARALGDPSDAANAVFAAVQGRLTYVPGATMVHTTATDAFAAGKGVCQDFVHVSLALLRVMGIPARYVSGYVHNRPSAALGETVRGESHAWVDVWTGDWWSYDPTGDVDVGERHVVIATGRDYRDVAPLKGVFSGAKLQKLEVAVDLIRRA